MTRPELPDESDEHRQPLEPVGDGQFPPEGPGEVVREGDAAGVPTDAVGMAEGRNGDHDLPLDTGEFDTEAAGGLAVGAATGQAEVAEAADPPIDRQQDVMETGAPLTGDPKRAYNQHAFDVSLRLNNGQALSESPELRTDVAQGIALRDVLRPKLLEPAAAERAVQIQEAEMTNHKERLEPYGVNVDDVVEEAIQLSPPNVVDYHLKKLEEHTEHLKTGADTTVWPEATDDLPLTSRPMTEHVQVTSDLVGTALKSLQGELGDAHQQLADRYERWLDDTVDLQLANGHTGIATRLAINAPNEQAEARMVDKLAGEFDRLHEAGDEVAYERAYIHARETLSGPMREAFLERAPQPAGATQASAETQQGVTVRPRAVDRPMTAILADGRSIRLPFTDQEMHVVSQAGALREERTIPARTISYEELDEAAKNAITTAVVAEITGDRAEQDLVGTPQYRRLAISAADGTLRPVEFRPGDNRPLDTVMPANLLGPAVADLQPVADGYMVVPNEGGLRSLPMYRDSDPNLFGPETGNADAWRVRGTILRVTDPNNPVVVREQTGSAGVVPRWFLIPVTFYRAET
jgi:hypothetical protein